MVFDMAQRAINQTYSAPGPTAGLQLSDALFMDEHNTNAALLIENMIPREFGCEVRQGSREIATGLKNALGLDGEVRSLIFFDATTGPDDNKVFAATDAGIYDITAGGAGPWTPVYAWPITSGLAGWCSYTSYTNPETDHYLLLCDEANGYVVYDGEAGTWAAGSIGETLDAADVVQIVEWQSRIWFVERDTARAWYLGIGALGGTATALDMGSRFLKGGNLVQLSDWTMDDGEGMNDRLIAMSSAGDVLVFSGTDPDSSTSFNMIGRWYVGAPPAGRRVMSEWGGSVMLLSTYGLITADVLTGSGLSSGNAWISRNIAKFFREEIKTYGANYGWDMELQPSDGLGFFTVPNVGDAAADAKQYVLNIASGAWCTFAGLDMICISKNADRLLFGTRDGRVMEHIGTQDDVPLSGATGDAISFQILTQYGAIGQPANYKIAKLIRTSWMVGDTTVRSIPFEPEYAVEVRFDFGLERMDTVAATSQGALSLWDSAIWDVATWGGSSYPIQDTRGVSGMGLQAAIALSGQTYGNLTYLGFDLTYTTGGLL